MPDWDTQMSLQDQDGYRYDRASASSSQAGASRALGDQISPDGTAYYSLTYVDVPEDAVGLTWKFSDGVSGAAFDLPGIGLLQAIETVEVTSTPTPAPTEAIVEVTPTPTAAPTMAEYAPDDHVNDFESATRIAIGEAVTFELEDLDDREVFAFRARPGTEFLLTLNWEYYEFRENYTESPLLAVYNANGQEQTRLMGYELYEKGGPSIGLVWRAVAGGDYYFVIGDGNTVGASAFSISEGEATEPTATPAPTAPPAPPASPFASVSAGRYHTCGVKNDGSVACWGYNEDGQATPPAGSFVSVTAGSFHTCGVRSDGSVACWGDNEDGQATPPAGSFVSVSAGGDHTCGVRANGSVACWGSNLRGRATPPAGSFVSVSAGSDPHMLGEEQ